jgi:hypothetical protein
MIMFLSLSSTFIHGHHRTKKAPSSLGLDGGGALGQGAAQLSRPRDWLLALLLLAVKSLDGDHRITYAAQ